MFIKNDDLKNKLGSGDYGICYLYNNYVVKILKTDIPKEIKEEIMRNINLLLNYKIKDVAFPIELINTLNNDFGYVMPKIEGIKFYDLLNNDFIDLNCILKSYDDARKKIYQISNKKILMSDVRNENCTLMDNGCFGIFDVDFYTIRDDLSNEEILRHNIVLINAMFSNFLEDLVDKLIANKKYSVYDLVNIKLFLKNIDFKIKVIENPENIKFIDDFSHILRKVTNSRYIELRK